MKRRSNGIRWTLITVTYNSAEDIRTYWDRGIPDDVEWIVVDNGSADESVDVAWQAGASNVVELHDNRGFGFANNMGFSVARGEYIAFVNPDVRVDFDSLDILAEAIDKAGGLVAPQLVNPDGSAQPNGRGFPTLRNKVLNRLGKVPDGYFIFAEPGSSRYVCWVIGAVVASRRDIFADLHVWDDTFFVYYEDSDLGMRAWAAGFTVEVIGSAQWVHGWARATTKMSLKPWIREFASMRKFYQRYPRLLWSASLAARSYSQIDGSIGRDSRTPGASATSAAAKRLRVVIDLLASPEFSGGMHLHAYEIVDNWRHEFPQDQLIVIGPSWARREIGKSRNVRHVTWPNDNFAARILGEMLLVPTVSICGRAVLLSLSPVLSPLVRHSKSYAVSHDWRHVGAPEQFSRAQLIYRRIWRTSLRRAATVFAISSKTATEVATLEPSARVAIVANGRDHARRWLVTRSPRESDGTRKIVTFGHKNHKRPELVIEALAHADPDVGAIELVVLGASGSYRAELIAFADRLGVGARCTFPGFIDPQGYEAIVSQSDVVLLVSTDEGFGLPVVEAEYFSIPAIIAADSGLECVHPNAIIAAPTAAGIAEAIRLALSADFSPPEVSWRWADAVRRMRHIIEEGGVPR